MRRWRLCCARVAILAVLLAVIVPMVEGQGKAEPAEPARARYKPAPIVAALGIRG